MARTGRQKIRFRDVDHAYDGSFTLAPLCDLFLPPGLRERDRLSNCSRARERANVLGSGFAKGDSVFDGAFETHSALSPSAFSIRRATGCS